MSTDKTAPGFCILRVAKLKTMGSISGSAKHTFREIETKNADATRTHLNVTIGSRTSEAVCAAVKSRLPEKRRKDAVLCLEYLITASPEWFKTAPTKVQNEYFKAATKWLQDRHGKENIVCLNMQNDETSPHMVAYIVPKTKEGKLSAKEFVGGPAKLRKMQSDFADKVGKPVGLERGVEGSKAEHTTIKKYYTELNKNPALKPPAPPAPSLVDRITGKAKAEEEEHEERMRAFFAQVEQARNVALASTRARHEQLRAIGKLRKEAEEMRGFKIEAERLREENKKLRFDLEAQKKYFLAKIEGLKNQLKQAVDKAAAMLVRIGLLERQVDSANAEVDALREQQKRKASQFVKLQK